jgi:hypothetical protein
MKLGLLAAIAIAASTFGCKAFVADVTPYIPVLTGVACQVANDQGTAEPGWIVWICNKLDGNGAPLPTGYTIHLPSGVTPKTPDWKTAKATP